MKKIFTVLVALALPICAFSDGAPPKLGRQDVQRFVDNAEACDHLAGEWDPDLSKKEKRVIERNVDKHCGMAQRQRTVLLKRYKADADVMAVLNKYDSVKEYTPAK